MIERKTRSASKESTIDYLLRKSLMVDTTVHAACIQYCEDNYARATRSPSSFYRRWEWKNECNASCYGRICLNGERDEQKKIIHIQTYIFHSNSNSHCSHETRCHVLVIFVAYITKRRVEKLKNVDLLNKKICNRCNIQNVVEFHHKYTSKDRPVLEDLNTTH